MIKHKRSVSNKIYRLGIIPAEYRYGAKYLKLNRKHKSLPKRIKINLMRQSLIVNIASSLIDQLLLDLQYQIIDCLNEL